MVLRTFFQKPEYTGNEIIQILKAAVEERAPFFIQTPGFQFEGDVMAQIDDIFYVTNTLSANEIVPILRNREVEFRLAQGGTLFSGITTLKGLGMHRNLHMAKFQVPQSLEKRDSRSSFRLKHFSSPPMVTFSIKDAHLARGKLADVSMTGLALIPDFKYTFEEITIEPGLILKVDVRLNEEELFRCQGVIRHITHNKIGIQFRQASSESLHLLQEYMTQQRKFETIKKVKIQNQAAQKRNNPTSEPPPETGKPLALIIGKTQEDAAEFLKKCLSRRFDTEAITMDFIQVKATLEAKPYDLLLFQLPHDSSASVSRFKKLALALAGSTPFLFFSDDLTPEFIMTHFAEPEKQKLLLNTSSRNVLMIYKTIERFFEKK